jgi:hypothetical protein
MYRCRVLPDRKTAETKHQLKRTIYRDICLSKYRDPFHATPHELQSILYIIQAKKECHIFFSMKNSSREEKTSGIEWESHRKIEIFLNSSILSQFPVTHEKTQCEIQWNKIRLVVSLLLIGA